MKRILFRFCFAALIAGTIVSCNDATDILQKSELSDEVAFQTVADLQTGLNGAYGAYGPDFGGNGDGDAILFNDLFTDNFKRGLASNNQGAQEYNWILMPASDPNTRIWSNRYATINRVNRVLRAYDRIAPGLTDLGDIATAEHIKGQLLALRALAHFDLLQYFAPSYSDRNALGVIIMDFVPNIEDSFERNTVGEVFDFVNQDLVDALDLLNSSVDNVSRFYIDEDVVKAIRARVAIFEGNNILAETLATELIANYPLATPTQYLDMWADGASPENIFVLSRVPGNNRVAALYYANETNITGSPFFEMSNQLYNLYEDTDVRKLAFVDETSVFVGVNSPDNILLINKYPGSDELLLNDIKLFRTSEMVLIQAEARARQANLTGARNSLQQLVDSRYFDSPPVLAPFGTLNVALAEILVERRKEFAFEGHRWLDLKRIGREIGLGVDRLPVDAASFTAPEDLLPNDYRWTLPVPQAEINANNVITQNLGYN